MLLTPVYPKRIEKKVRGRPRKEGPVSARQEKNRAAMDARRAQEQQQEEQLHAEQAAVWQQGSIDPAAVLEHVKNVFAAAAQQAAEYNAQVVTAQQSAAASIYVEELQQLQAELMQSVRSCATQPEAETVTRATSPATRRPRAGGF